MTIQDIKIRNAYSYKNDLIFTYKDGDKRKEFIIPNYLWYCIIRTDDWLNYEKKLRQSCTIEKVEISGGNAEWTKIYSDKNEGHRDSGANKLVKALTYYGIEHFESDLHSAKRFMVDNEVVVDDQYDILYFDIETDDTNRKIQIGATRILSFGAVDNLGNEFYFDDEDEKLLLQKAIKLFKKYDIITGWNSDEFDLPYIFGSDKTDDDGNRIHITGRAEYHKLPKFKKHIVARIDMLKRARKLFKEDAKLKSYSLENVSQYFLKKGKLKYEGKVVDMYNNDKEKLRKYNMNDVYLLKELDEKVGMIDLVAKECAMAKCLIRDFAGVFVSQVLDSMILREAHKNNQYAPSKKFVKDPIDYAGGLVFKPDVGYHKNVYVFDFKSLYPSIIMTSNIGFDTVDKHDGFTSEDIHYKTNAILSQTGIKHGKIEDDTWIINPGTQVKFLKHEQSIIAKVVGQLVEERQIYKTKRLNLVANKKMGSEEYNTARANEIIVKELSNSVYGIMGNQGLRYYSLETAESITKTGHYLLRFSRDYFNNIKGLKVIYGDTDSLFVSSEKKLDVEKVLKKYHQELQDNLRDNFNIDKSYISLKYEELFGGLIMVGKKYYAGYVTNIEGKEVNEFIVKGLDMVKKATLPITVENQRKVIDMILDGRDENDMRNYIGDVLYKLENDKFEFDDLKISTGINKEIKDYKMVNAPHVKLARAEMEKTGVLEINEIEYIVTDNDAPKDSIEGLVTRENYIGEFDKNYYWNQKIFPPIQRVLTAAFPEVDWDEEFIIKKIRKSKKLVLEGQQPLF